MMIDFEINDKGTLVWNDGSSRPATHQEQELTYEIAYRDDQIKELQAEVERLKPISVKDQLPKPKQRVNVITNWDGFLPFFYINEEGDWVSETYQWRGQVTHWMPIPEVKEQAND